MSSSPLTASQLDRIEDALEDLELGGVPDGLRAATDESSVTVASHLDAYQQILVMARDAMPMEEAPAGALAGVFAEARAAAATPAVVAPAAAAEEAKPGLWQRLRATVWVPALGFAGAAAMLLLFMRPADDADAPATIARADEPVPEPERQADKAAAEPAATPLEQALEGRLADAESTRRVEEDGIARGQGAFAGEDPSDALGKEKAPDEPAEEPETEEELDAVPEDRASGVSGVVGGSVSGAGTRSKNARPGLIDKKDERGGDAPPPPPAEPSRTEKKPTSKSPSAPKKKSKGKKSNSFPGKDLPPAKPSAPAPKADPSPGGEVGNDAGGAASGKADAGPTDDGEQAMLSKLLSRGESRRRAGNCGLARLDFQKARDATVAKTRARALAGLGLCELAAGNDSAANTLFDSARAADRDVAGFIQRERTKIEAGSAQKQSKKKK